MENTGLLIPFIAESPHVLIDICVVGATLGILYNLVAAVLVLRFAEKPEPASAPLPEVSILKPLHGIEPGLFRRLSILCEQDYPGQLQLVCGTQQKADPAIATVELLQRLRTRAEVELVVDERTRGTNRKVGNLLNMEPRARHELIVLSDSDIMVDARFLRRIAAELQASDVGAVTCLYYGVALGGLWSRLAALNINCQFLPNVIVALTFGAATPCFGSAIALRSTMLKQIGGFGSFLDELADDYAIGQAVRSTGRRVAVSHWAVGHACCDRSLRALWDHQIRAARTIRSIDPIGYLGTIFMHPVTLSALSGLGGSTHPVALIAAALSARALLSLSVERAYDVDHQSIWLLPLHDAISFAVFFCSFVGRRVQWRGQAYSVLTDGTIEDSAIE